MAKSREREPFASEREKEEKKTPSICSWNGVPQALLGLANSSRVLVARWRATLECEGKENFREKEKEADEEREERDIFSLNFWPANFNQTQFV